MTIPKGLTGARAYTAVWYMLAASSVTGLLLLGVLICSCMLILLGTYQIFSFYVMENETYYITTAFESGDEEKACHTCEGSRIEGAMNDMADGVSENGIFPLTPHMSQLIPEISDL